MPSLHCAATKLLVNQKTTLGLSAQALILTCLRPLPKRHDYNHDDFQGSSLRGSYPWNRIERDELVSGDVIGVSEMGELTRS
jgi:hypothetical protein